MSRLETKQLSSKQNAQARLALKRRFLRFLIRVIGFNLLVKLDKVEGLENIPLHGPVILMMNHISFVDSLVVLHLAPRHIVPMAKVEVYDYPIVGIFPRIWQVIPVRREEVDRRAIQMAITALKDGEIILVAPEGTRGTNLREGKEGVAYLASRSGAVVVPVALMGTVGFPTFRLFKRWKGPGVHVRVGKPFRYRPGFERASGEQLRKMTDEAMYLLSALLVEPLRGVYSDLSAATQDTLEELPEPTNLHREDS